VVRHKGHLAKGADAYHPYYTTINGSTLAAVSALITICFLERIFPGKPGAWDVGSSPTFVCLRSRVVYFSRCIFCQFLPVIFLVNHRVACYWYLPFLGVCGLVAC